MRRPRDNVVVHGSDPAPRIRSPASDRRIRSPDGTFDNERGPTIRNLAAFPAKAGRFPPGEAGLNERGELQSIVPIASSAPLRRESRRRALKRHGPDPGPPLSRPDELPASGGMRAAGPFGESPPPGGGQGGAISNLVGRSPVLGLSVQRVVGLPTVSRTFRSLDRSVLAPPRGVGGASPSCGLVRALGTHHGPRSAVVWTMVDGGHRPEARPSSVGRARAAPSNT